MFNFKDVVVDILLEQEPATGAPLDQNISQQLLTFLNSKVANLNLDEQGLERVYKLFQGPYFTGEQFVPENMFNLLPVLDIIAQTYNGVGKTKETAKKTNVDINSFYTGVINKLNTFTGLKSIAAGYEFTDPEINRIFTIALKLKSKNVLVQNVWPQINLYTIIDGITKIFQTRLTGLERAKISMLMLNQVKNEKITSLATFNTYSEAFLKDLFNNVDVYSSGSKKINSELASILLKINVTYNDLLEIATYTQRFYKSLLYNQFPDFNVENSNDKTSVEASLEKIKENTYNLAKFGHFTYTLKYTQINIRPTEITDKNEYILKYIENLDNPEGNKITDKIKEISTGVRENDAQFQQLVMQGIGGILKGLGALTSDIGPVN